MNKHDYIRPRCTKAEPELIGTHSNGTKFYRCRNCGHAGPQSSFSEDFHVSEITQLPQ